MIVGTVSNPSQNQIRTKIWILTISCFIYSSFEDPDVSDFDHRPGEFGNGRVPKESTKE